MLSLQHLSAGLYALDESSRLRPPSLLDRRGRRSTHYALPAGPDPGELERLHLKPPREACVSTPHHLESKKHPHQAYLTVEEDQEGLQ